jgi:hypothetical protein
MGPATRALGSTLVLEQSDRSSQYRQQTEQQPSIAYLKL